MENNSKTKIKKRLTKKRNQEIVDTIIAANKNPKWGKVAALISGSRKHYSVLNLNQLEKVGKEGDTLIVIGKVLGGGEFNKKMRICALGFSKDAEEKIKKTKGDSVSILEEIKKNVNAENIKIIR